MRENRPAINRSVPPRGSGWVPRIADCGFRIVDWNSAIGIQQSAILSVTHPLPRGGTELFAGPVQLHESVPFLFEAVRDPAPR